MNRGWRDWLLPSPTLVGDGDIGWKTLRRAWPLIAAWLVLGGSVGALGMIFLPPTFVAQGSFVVEQRTAMRGGGALGALASELGLGAGGGSGTGPQYFADLLRARAILVAVAARKVPLRTGDSVLVQDLVAGAESDLAERQDQARRRLNAAVSVVANTRTGVVAFDVAARDPVAAAAIGAAFLDELDRFVAVTRRSSARAQRQFAERRLTDATDSLAAVESSALHFLQTNREYRSAPQLVFRYEQLQRQISTYQQLVSSIRQQYEVARIEEVNDTPQITVLDAPAPPLHRTSPRIRSTVGVGALLGLVVAALLIGAAGRRREPAAEPKA